MFGRRGGGDGADGDEDRVEQPEERRGAGAGERVGDLRELAGGDPVVLGAGDAVDEGEGELDAVGVVDHGGELLRRRRGLLDGEPFLGPVDGLLDRRLDVGGVRWWCVCVQVEGGHVRSGFVGWW